MMFDKRDKSIILGVVSCLLFVFVLSGCWENQETKDSEASNEQQKQYAISQPVPRFDWSLERDLVIQLYQARNREVATHTVWRSNYGMVEGDCKSVGFGIPYDTSLTNPLKRIGGAKGPAVVEQAEPNGIFASKNSAATWVMCVVEEGDRVSTVPVYIESKVTVYPFPVDVDYDTNRVARAVGGVPSVTMTPR